MENIIKSIVMLIDMYYHHKKLMKRWKSIKRYQRTGIIDNKSTVLLVNKPKYISAAENAVKNKLVNSKSDYYQMLANSQAKPNDNDLYKLNANILSYLNNVGAKANIIHNMYDMRDVLAIDITYKNYLQRFEYSDYYYNHNDTILNHIKVFIKQTDLKIEKFEEDRKLLHKKNNPHSLELNKQYLLRYKFNEEDDWKLITISRFTDEGYPWGYEKRGVITPNMYDIKTTDGKWIHNCKQWDEFQAKKKLSNEYQLIEADLKYLRNKGVRFSIKLSDNQGEHSFLKVLYRNETFTHIFYSKPLKADIFSSIMDCVKTIDRKQLSLGIIGTGTVWDNY